MIVVVLINAPKFLRGDITKWCQELQTGVYVGCVSARIREQLWERISKNIGQGEATFVYNTNNELGYSFRTTRKDKKVIDFNGLPLMKSLLNISNIRNVGFSNAYRYHQTKKFSNSKKTNLNFVAIDIETTGLSPINHQIISIGAVKQSFGHFTKFYQLVKLSRNQHISENISKLTGLNDKILLKKGVSVSEAIIGLRQFIKDLPLVGYNFSFDQSFLETAIVNNNLVQINNRMFDLLPFIKHIDKFCDNYQLSTILSKHGVLNKHPHNALSDANAIMELAVKLIKDEHLKI